MQLRSTATVRFTRRALCAGVALAFGAAQAQPKASDLTNVHGSATVEQIGATTTIRTTNGPRSNHSALDWRGFQVPGGTVVHFEQPAQSMSINRVTDGVASSINGALTSNGRLVLVNPAGIAIGGGVRIDTAGFVASTLAMSTRDAIAGRLRFAGGGNGDDDDDDEGGKKKGKGKGGTLSVQAKGSVLAAGDVVLIGKNVDIAREAIIRAVGGDVILAAGEKVEITGRGLEGIRMELSAMDGRAVNLGTLAGDSVGIFAGTLRHSGLIQAKSVTTSGGKVILQALKDTEVDGRIEASNAARGGSVLISGDKLELKKATFVDVSHANGGGEILVGGGSRGGDARLRNADEVKVDDGAVLKADATLSGSGGTVVVWSERRTDFRGAILARYEGAGRGGRVEVSSRREIKYKGSVDIGPGGSAPVSDDGKDNSGKDKGGKDKEAKPSKGLNFDPEFVVPMIPLEAQSVEVQAAITRPGVETTQAMRALEMMGPMSSKPEDPYRKGEVVVTAVQCTVTR
jgi:filamentous hemagglutinin family protein